MELSFLQTIVAHTYKFTAGLDYNLDIKHFVALSKFSCWLHVFQEANLGGYSFHPFFYPLFHLLLDMVSHYISLVCQELSI